MDRHPFRNLFSEVLRRHRQCVFISAVTFLAYASNTLDSIPTVAARFFFLAFIDKVCIVRTY